MRNPIRVTYDWVLGWADRPGGVLVAFGCEEEDTAAAGEQRLDSLRIVRHDGPRQRFRRAGT